MLSFYPKVNIKRLRGSYKKPRNYTCYGRIHVEVALVICMCLELFLGVLQFILTKHHNVVFIGVTDSIVKFFDFIEFIALCFLTLAMWYKSAKWMFPYMVLQFYFFIGWFLYCILFIITFLFPDLPVKSMIYHMDDALHESLRIIAFIYVTIFEAWFLKVSIACYVYYSNNDKDTPYGSTQIRAPFEENDNRLGPIIEVFENPNYRDGNESDDDLELERPVFSSFPNAQSLS